MFGDALVAGVDFAGRDSARDKRFLPVGIDTFDRSTGLFPEPEDVRGAAGGDGRDLAASTQRMVILLVHGGWSNLLREVLR